MRYAILPNNYGIGQSKLPLKQYVKGKANTIAEAKQKARLWSDGDRYGYYIYDLQNKYVVQAFYGIYS